MSDPVFPVQHIFPDLSHALQAGNAIVCAPPGAGKSTQLPLHLLRTISNGKILLMQPRRVVVRNLAHFLAKQLGEQVGETIGYRIKGDTKVSADTRLEVITEGILTRMMQHDPELEGVAVVVFDEFHERSIHADFGLALAIEIQQGLRDDLRLVVMSATLDVQSVQRLLPDAPVLESQGRMFEVETHYGGQTSPEKLSQTTVQTIHQALDNHVGDLLVFLPGAKWILQCERMLQEYGRLTSHAADVHLLYGALSTDDQLAAIQPAPAGRRKIILATNIAETSLTIEGITVVIDSGREQAAQFHLATGVNELTLQMISQASAIQRQGRAGRVQAGVCYRLWPREQQGRLAKTATPQILREDITPLLLDTLQWGTTINALALIDQPSHAQQNHAFDTLLSLQAIDDTGKLLARGKALANYPCHPRIAALLERVKERDEQPLHVTAAWVAAYLEDLPRASGFVSDVLRTLPELSKKRLLQQAKRFATTLQCQVKLSDVDTLISDDIALCLALANPDFIAKKQQTQFKLAAGRGATWDTLDTSKLTWVCIANGQVKHSELQIFNAEPIEEATLRQWFSKAFHQQDWVAFNKANARMEARTGYRFGHITLSSEPTPKVAKSAWAQAWREWLLAQPLTEWPLDEKAHQWLCRVALAKDNALRQPQAFDVAEPWPNCTEDTAWLVDCVMASLAQCKTLSDLTKLNWAHHWQQALSWPQQDALNQFLPTSMSVPSGQVRGLEYKENGDVLLPVKLPEMYGLSEPIRIADGKVTVTIALLSPAGRPIQLTQDLGRFWSGTYKEVQKEMKGRYPKHFWPDDPATAKPTTKTKRNMS